MFFSVSAYAFPSVPIVVPGSVKAVASIEAYSQHLYILSSTEQKRIELYTLHFQSCANSAHAHSSDLLNTLTVAANTKIQTSRIGGLLAYIRPVVFAGFDRTLYKNTSWNSNRLNPDSFLS